jgi:hypothetical protein
MGYFVSQQLYVLIMPRKLLPIFLFFFVFAANAQSENPEQEIKHVIDSLYGNLSFTGQWKQAPRLLDLFYANARLIANFGASPQVWTVDEYIASVQDNVSKQGITAIGEKEIFGKTDVFGKVAQRLSTYQIVFTTKEKAISRTGINFIQLIQVNGRWKISSLAWDRESDRLKVPAQYKPADR